MTWRTVTGSDYARAIRRVRGTVNPITHAIATAIANKRQHAITPMRPGQPPKPNNNGQHTTD